MKKNDIPLQLFPDLFAALNDIEPSPEDYKDFVLSLQEYVNGNFDYIPTNKAISGVMGVFRRSAKLRYESYLSKCDKLRENGAKGGKAPKKPKTQDAENHSSYEAIATNCNQLSANVSNTNTNTTTTDVEGLNNKLLTPSPSSKDSDGGGEEYNFEDFFSIWQEAKKIGRGLIDKYANSIGHWSQVQYQFFDDCCRMFADPKNREKAIEIAEQIMSSNEGNAKTIREALAKAVSEGKLRRSLFGVIEWQALTELNKQMPNLNDSDFRALAYHMNAAPSDKRWNILKDTLDNIAKNGETIKNPFGLIIARLKM